MLLCGFLLSAVVISTSYGVPVDENKTREQLWTEVEQARKDRLPKTEMELLQRIYDLAVAEDAMPDAARALFQKIATEAAINQPAAPFAIKKLQAEIEQVPDGLKPITDAVLADWMYTYFQNNRWQFQQRTQTATDVGTDFQTWDLRRILSAVDQSLTDALSQEDQLKKIPITDYAILTQGGDSQADLRRPTVYDFIVNRALSFYSLDEQIIEGVDAFYVTAESPIFSSDTEFLAWKPVTNDDDSFALKTIRLYQQLLSFHQDDEDQTAYLAADLDRLKYANREAKGSDKKQRYRSALQRFADQHKQHPISSEALAALAQSHVESKELVEAHRIATIGLNRFKDSLGGAMCHNLIRSVEAPSASVTTELIWNSVKPDFSVNYKNLKQIEFRLVKYQPAPGEMQFRVWSTANRSQQQRRAEILAMPAAKQWNVDLPATEDFQLRTEKVDMPDDLGKGTWLLIGVTGAGDKGQEVLFAEMIQRTDLAHISRSNYGSGANLVSGQVLNAITGLPVEGASVKAQANVRQGQRNTRMETVAQTVTDKDGLYSFQGQQNHGQYFITITDGDDATNVNAYNNGHSHNPDETFRRASFFTDRSIYRPGQSVHFKVVCSSSDQKNGQYKAAANQKLTVQFYDANNQVIESLDVVTNDLGSASGTFTSPADRGTGWMRLETHNSRFEGSTGISVEEYKRPKFKVDIDKPEKSFALNDNVTVTGHAMAYNGAAIDGAKVSYRVVRTVRFADWWYWRCWWAPVNLPQKEIGQGNLETKADGSFEISFDAVPDPDADREGQPMFVYTVYADVTDSAGETRSSNTRVNVGFVSLAATVTHEKWLTPEKPVPFKITTKTLDGVGQTATGQLIVRKLTPPEKLQRKSITPNYGRPGMSKSGGPDLSNYRNWPVGDVVQEAEVTTDKKGAAEKEFEIGAGAFQVTFETTDPSGEKVSAISNFLVVDPDAKVFPVKVADYFAAEKKEWQPGETFTAIWGTGYETGRAYVEVFHRNKQVSAFWTDADSTQRKIEVPIEEKHRGGLQVVVNYVRENRLYSHPVRVDVPWDNKKLQVKWNHFVSKLQPGGKETWTAVVSGEDAQSKAIEMVAAMYDSSLDQFSPHEWQTTLGDFYFDNFNRQYQFSNRQLNLNRLGNFQRGSSRSVSLRHRRFANAIGLPRTRQARTMRMKGRMAFGAEAPMAPSGAMAEPVEGMMMEMSAGQGEESEAAFAADESFDFGDSDGERGENDDAAGGEAAEPDLTQVSIRKNLQETAFFYPNLIADADGQVKIEFEVPEALTTWKFMGLAHDGQLRTGMLTDEMTTSKDLMVQPNPPRFLREGDQLYFSVKVTNQSDKVQTGVVQLQLNNAFDEEPIDEAFGNSDSKKTFEVPAKESRSYHWELTVPDYVGALTYKVVGASETVSDGEEGLLPVLSKRILVTESLPLPVRGNQTRKFTFDALDKMDKSDSLKNETLTIQMTSNPSWYAVMALPYLMEYPHQCSEQTFNRLYANALGQKIVNSNPRIEKIFAQWRGTDALKSPLEKNDELRNVMIAESPWLLAGKNESQARRNVGLLFESNRINQEIKKAQARMAEMQLPDGAWPWFAGGRSNHYLTLYITTGFGRLRNLGVDVDVQTAIASLEYLDGKVTERYQRLKDSERLDKNNFSPTMALYLYGRSFFLKDKAISDQNRPAFDYFVGQAKTYWTKQSSRQAQAHVAIAMKRLNDLPTAQAIMKSLTERSQRDDEMGQYWAEAENAWFWYQAPIETQALLIEAYDEVLGDAESVEECKIWLLKQKQTQAWKTTKATADAVYALLLRGSDRLASTKLVGVTWGGERVQPAEVEAGTGFFEQKITGGDIKSSQKEIAVVKTDDGIAWGSIHWQYLEDVSKIEPYEGTPLTVKKSLFIKKNTDNGPEISAVAGPVEIGDELVTRVEIRVDRDMEFVHLKDYRGSGTEPVNVLSRYKMQDGLYYYESTRDTASHFFIEYLPKGTYVFESSVRVQHGGKYQTGIAEVQCMYAPEYNSHSNSVAIEVTPAEVKAAEEKPEE